jgi:hypothetical protein
MLPNFLLIGGARCATTWVHRCLGEHPAVFTSPTKEIDFFSEHYGEGIDHYRTFFSGRSDGAYTACGEASTSYLSHPECPRRIAEHLPAAKLVAVLRNPIDRAFSHFLMFQRNHPERSFESALEGRPGLVGDGMYHEHLTRYLEHVDRDRLLILLFDDIKPDPAAFMRQIYAFLELDDTFVPPSLVRPTNVVIYPALQESLRRVGLGWSIELARKTPLSGLLRRLAHRKKLNSYPKMQAETRRRLRQTFAAPNQRLADLIDRDLDHWK